MKEQTCPACKSSNDEKAAYCDQCGQPMAAPKAGAEGDCPACGGIVENRGGGKGVCASCGLELAETLEESSCCGVAPAGTVERLTAAILGKTRAGLPVEQAVAEGCREVLKAAAPEETVLEVADGPQACPLCAAESPCGAPKCGGCGIWFQRPRAPQPCPRCEREVPAGGKCRCGAILTLPELMEYIEPSVRLVCSRCHQPYAVAQEKCPDCGGGLLSAEGLKAYAAGASAQ